MSKQFLNFLLVGGLNTVVGYFFFVGFSYVGLRYPLAVLCANVFGVLFNYKTTGSMVFHTRTHHAIGAFIAVYMVLYCINVLLMSVALYWVTNVYMAGLLITLPVALLAFILNKHFVFKE